jgi:colanic acid/amylovoran biosynthesis glycosyltransferase
MRSSSHSVSAMHIAYVVYRFPQLSESFILDQITGMLDLGQEVGIYAEVGPTDDPVHPQVEAYKLLERTRYLPGPSRSRLGSTRQVGHALLAKPGLVGWIMASRKKPLREAIRSLAKVHGFVWPRAPKFDIVHCQFGCVAREYWFSKSLWNAKLVVSFRGHDFSSLPRIYGPALYEELFQQVDAVTVVCNYAVTKLLELGCPREKLVIHYSGTDLKEFAFHERIASLRGQVRVLTVARLEESKGLEFALRAMADLIHRHRLEVRYGIVGSGSLRGALEGLAASLKIQDKVEFFGALPRPRVRDLMHRYHIFLLPSVTSSDGSQEGIPGSVREAMATGMPVVSTVHSGIPELVADGVSGFLVAERDVEALAERLRDLVTHPEWWSAMGRRGREHVERHFEIRRLNRRLEALYRHVLAGRVPAEFESHERSDGSELYVSEARA